ncbi:Alcohol dehydrogenase (EC [Olavius algarvensis associated proteobacterium Delta 3]|nr:Alcohol dehydrogenase (EC [Olavius algarvensis associated proteobacterium Delta 3]CAB5098768.1 Alcohol dehydrogenase (EC [Olavius algarvensis associated proteobacterium Delta 3]
MKAAVYREFAKPLTIQNLPDPTPSDHGVVIRVEATGLCRSDWHGWMGHDPDIRLPHVPGHELAGVIEATGKDIIRWNVGDRVTLPFVCGCGICPQCATGNHQVCDRQFQPGFTHWGSFAEYVAIDYADVNIVTLPDEIDFVTAASLGCRFVTSFRAIVEQGNVSAGQWVAVHGCGGVGLSAIMIANALGANVVGVDINDEKLDFAKLIGATATVNASNTEAVAQKIIDLTEGGAHVSIDALGSPVTCFNSIVNLRKRGKHIQVGLMLADHRHPAVPMDQIIANELEILGSHGMQAHKYSELLLMIRAGKLFPEKLVQKTISLEESLDELVTMDSFSGTGITVIDKF